MVKPGRELEVIVVAGHFSCYLALIETPENMMN